MGSDLRYLPGGDCALTIEFGSVVDRRVNRRVMALCHALEARTPEGVIALVPTFRSLTVHYDPLVIGHDRLCDTVAALESGPSEEVQDARMITIPVCYGGAHGPDLADVAEAGGLTEDAAIALHSDITHHVYMIGFAPGHPYLGDLPDALRLPRRKTPRKRIAPGTVAVAVGQTVIYPFASPGGWHAIGQTPAVLFDITRETPTLLRAGDKVRFRPVSAGEFDDLLARPAPERIEMAQAQA